MDVCPGFFHVFGFAHFSEFARGRELMLTVAIQDRSCCRRWNRSSFLDLSDLVPFFALLISVAGTRLPSLVHRSLKYYHEFSNKQLFAWVVQRAKDCAIGVNDVTSCIDKEEDPRHSKNVGRLSVCFMNSTNVGV